jgi:hypothetical protein
MAHGRTRAAGTAPRQPGTLTHQRARFKQAAASRRQAEAEALANSGEFVRERHIISRDKPPAESISREFLVFAKSFWDCSCSCAFGRGGDMLALIRLFKMIRSKVARRRSPRRKVAVVPEEESRESLKV